MHLAWFNSLYGEAMMYIGILLCIGCALETISARRGSRYGLIMSVVMSGCTYCLVMSKPQSVLSLFMWFGASGSMLMYHSKGVKAFCRSRRMLASLCACIIAFNTIYTAVCSVAFYRWNSKLVEKDTLYQSITYGALLLTDQPEQMCIEMGIDPIMAKDIGKGAYQDVGEYVTPPRSAEAEERLYSRINTFSLLRYYVTHPQYLFELLERDAEYAVSPATMLHINYDASGELANARTFGTMWQKIRHLLVPRHFWQYVIFYTNLK